MIISESVSAQANRPEVSMAEAWNQVAKADYRLCREFARTYHATLPRSLRGQRVGWENYGHIRCAILLPDSLPSSRLNDDEWYLYYPYGESLFRRTRRERAQMQMIVLAESAEDWAELLRQAVREEVFDVRLVVAPHYINALGDQEHAPSGYEVTFCADAPQAVSSPFKLFATGVTPEAAAREACRRWLNARMPGLELT